MANKPFKFLKFKGDTNKYHPVDEEAREMIGNLSELETENKDNLVDAINEAAQSGGGGTSDYEELSNLPQIGGVTLIGNKTPAQLGLKGANDSDVFWATVGTTTYTQITNAVNANKLVCAKRALASGKNIIYYCLGKPVDSGNFLFVGSTPSTIYSYNVTNTSEWVVQSNISVLQLATSMPLMDGVASVGGLTKAAKADHVHPTDTSRASAQDVGDLSDLDTENKASLVDAINEVASQTVTPSAIQDAVDNYLDDHATITGTFTNEAKRSLLRLLEKVAYVDADGRDYLSDLSSKLFSATLSYITAAFNQGSAVIYDVDSLDSLKQYLTVTAYYANDTHEVLNDTDYTLSGTLTAGTSVITVACEDKTTTFNVTVTAVQPVFELSAPTSTANYDTQTQLFDTEKDFTIFCDASFNNYSWNGSKSIFGHPGFRAGYGSIDDYFYGSVDATNVTRYTALTLNPSETSSHYRGTSFLARYNGTQRKKIAVRYQASTRKIELFLEGDSTRMPPTTKSWFNASNVMYYTDTVKLNLSSSGGTVHVFKIYFNLLSDDAITNFLNGGA